MAASSSPSEPLDLEQGDPGPVVLETPRDLAQRIEETELARLLGYPDRRIPPGRAAAGAAAARDWYGAHGRPWALARRVTIGEIRGDEIRLAGGEPLTSPVLARRLVRGEAKAVALTAVSAGGEADDESTALWRRDRPDEAYFLERFAAAVVEYLAGWATSRLRADLEENGLGLLPSYSPGYRGWDLEQQVRLLHCLAGDGGSASPNLEVLESGMIRPKSSLLATFGITPRLHLAAEARRRNRCTWCSLSDCGFRRVSARRARARTASAAALRSGSGGGRSRR